MASQKVVIPKGLVNPNETTVIEIPQNLQRVPAVVAVRRGDDSGSSFCGGRPGALQSDYGQDSIPDYPSYPLIPEEKGETINEIRVRRDYMDFSDKGASFGGHGLDDPSGMSKAKFEDWVQKNTEWRLVDLEDEIIGPREESIDYSDPELRRGGFDPYVHTYQLRKFASPYKQFQPSMSSTPGSYVPTGESAMDWRNTSRPEELSYLRARHPAAPVGGQRLKAMPCGSDNADSATGAGIRDVLEKMEYIELSKIQQDLREFQAARRKLIFDATNMAPPKLGGCRGGSKIPRYTKTYRP